VNSINLTLISSTRKKLRRIISHCLDRLFQILTYYMTLHITQVISLFS